MKILDLKLGDISKKVADVWNNLPDEKKQVWIGDIQSVSKGFFCSSDICQTISRSKGELWRRKKTFITQWFTNRWCWSKSKKNWKSSEKSISLFVN
jgi:hypothetical protein